MRTPKRRYASVHPKNKLTTALEYAIEYGQPDEDCQSLAIVTDTNIRKEPNATSATVGEPLPEGTMLTIIGAAQGNWLPISYKGRYGYEDIHGFVYKPLVKTY